MKVSSYHPVLKRSNNTNEGKKTNLKNNLTAAGAGLAAGAGALYGPDRLDKTRVNPGTTSLKELTSKDLNLKMGIEHEWLIPDSIDKRQFTNILHNDVVAKHKQKGEFSYILPQFSSPGGLNSLQAEKAEDLMNRSYAKFNNKSNAKVLSPKEAKFLKEANFVQGKSSNVLEGFHVYRGGKPGTNKLDKVFELITDPSVKTWHRSAEFVTKPLKTKEDLQLYSDVVNRTAKMEPKPGPVGKLMDNLNNVRIQVGSLISREKPNSYGYEASRSVIPGYKKHKIAPSGYGSTHVHRDAAYMIDKNPLTLINFTNLYNKWEDPLTNIIDPGISREHYCQPMKQNFVNDLNKSVAPKAQKMIKDTQNNLSNEQARELMADIAKTDFKYNKNHVDLKYRALNPLNTYGQAIKDIAKEDEKLVPAPLRGVIGKKAGKKTTVELRILQNTTNPKDSLMVGRIMENMILKSKEAADKGEIISPEKVKYKPWQENKIINNFIKDVSREDAPIKFGDMKQLKKPKWDTALFDNIMTMNKKDALHPLGYEKVELPSLRTTMGSVKRFAKKRLELLKEPEVAKAAGVGAAVAAGTLFALNKLDKNPEVKGK